MRANVSCVASGKQDFYCSDQKTCNRNERFCPCRTWPSGKNQKYHPYNCPRERLEAILVFKKAYSEYLNFINNLNDAVKGCTLEKEVPVSEVFRGS